MLTLEQYKTETAEKVSIAKWLSTKVPPHPVSASFSDDLIATLPVQDQNRIRNAKAKRARRAKR